MSHIDKEALSQTLDHIHNAASQSESLTTFNEYTAPPSVSEGGEGRGIATELQGGLSGLYNRLRASVGGVRDTVGGGVVPDEDESADIASLQSPRSATPSAASSTKQLLGSSRPSIPGASSVQDAGPSIALQSPRIAVSETITNDQGPSPKISRIPTATSSKTPVPTAVAMKPPLTPLTPTVPTVPASPAIVEVNVSAFRDLESRPRHEDTLSRTSTLNQVHSKASSSPRADEHVSGATDNLEVGEKPRGRAVRSYSGLESVSSHKPEPLRASGEDATIPGVSSIKHTSSSSQLGGHLGDHSVTGNASSRFQDTDRTDASNLSKARTTGEARNTAEGASGLKNSDRPTNASEKRQAIMSSVSASAITEASGSNHSIDKTSAAKARIAPRIAQSHLPGFDLSRASSSDTVGTSPLNTTMYQKSSNGGPSEDERLRKQDMTQLRNPGKQDTERSSVNVISSHTRSRVLSKEYWMRDENARDCFYCGDSFSTFRRKHHCRKSISIYRNLQACCEGVFMLTKDVQGRVARSSMANALLWFPGNSLVNRAPYACANHAKPSSTDMMIRLITPRMEVSLTLHSDPDMGRRAQVNSRLFRTRQDQLL